MRFLFTVLLLMPLMGTDASDTPHPGVTLTSPDLQVYPLKANVWVHRSWSTIDGSRYPANGLIILDGEQLVLIDTAWGNALTEQLLAWMETRFGATPDLAILTHAHEDRIGGLPALAKRHIPAYVHPMTRALAEQQYPAEQLPLPLTELNEHASVSQGSLNVFYPGPAHSPDNIVIWYAKHQLLFGGCAVKSAEAEDIHYVNGSDPEGWPSAIDRILAHYPDTETVVPGHGQVGDATLLTHTLELAKQGAQGATSP